MNSAGVSALVAASVCSYGCRRDGPLTAPPDLGFVIGVVRELINNATEALSE